VALIAGPSASATLRIAHWAGTGRSDEAQDRANPDVPQHPRLDRSEDRGDLKGTDPIVARIARMEGVERFDHGRPADVLLREREAVLSKLSDETLKRFERLFERINNTLGK